MRPKKHRGLGMLWVVAMLAMIPVILAIRRFLSYYHGARTHLALDKDALEPRLVQPPDMGTVIEIPEVGGLHHRYERRAA